MLVNALLSGALQLVDPGETATLVEVHTGRHAALYSMGHLDEADAEYCTIEELCPAALDRAAATAVQMRSLTYRNRPAEAVDLAVGSLRELGIGVPPADRFPGEADRQFGNLYRWLDETDAAGDLTGPELTDPALLAAAGLLNAAGPAAYYAADHAAFAWFSLEALRMWLEHGPCPALVAVAGHAAYAAVALRGDYAAGCRALRRILAAGEARGYEPATSQARSVFALYCWWFEPLEHAIQEAQRAREGLLAGGALANAAYGYRTTVSYLLDCASTLDDFVAEVEAGLAFVRRTGNQHLGQSLDSYRWLAGALRGETPAVEEAVPDRYGNPLARVDAHLTRALAAAIISDQDGLARHTAAAMPLLPDTAGFYPAAMTRLLRGLALAGQARTAGGDQRGTLLAELDEQIAWLAARAADAPDNFAHLVRLLEAERAWAIGDSWAAALAFDAALREAARRQRPWHRALITERAARFSLGHGLEHIGYDLLVQARAEYAAWGATGKVAQLDWAHPGLRPGAATTSRLGHDPSAEVLPQRSTVTTGTLDLLGILSASQALSSETSIERLHARVVEVLGALTGATGVHLLLRSDDRHDWLLPTAGGAVPVSGTGHGHALPMSVLRYTQRVRETLVVADATGDDRFARDPYLTDLDCCALLALPILSRGTPAGGAAAGEPAHPRRVHHRAARRGQAHRRPTRRLPRQRPALRRLSPDRRRAGRAAAGGDAGRPRGAAGGGVRRGHRRGRPAARCRSREHEPVRPGQRGDGRRRLEEARAALPVGSRMQPRRAQRDHAGVRDRPAGADRPLRRGRLGADRRPRPPDGTPVPWSACRSVLRVGCGAS